MANDEAARHHLHQTLDNKIGQADAVTLMEHLPPVGWADVATNSDLDNVEHRLGARIDEVEIRLGARIDNLELRMEAQFAAMRVELANIELRLVERMRRHDQILIATLLPLTISLIGLLATAILRAPAP